MLGPPGWSMPVCKMDCRPGGRFEWRWKNDETGEQFGFTGEFREVEPHERLVFTQRYEPGEQSEPMNKNESTIAIEFESMAQKTLVRTIMTYESKEERDTALSTGMTDGMEMSYMQLDSILGDGEPADA